MSGDWPFEQPPNAEALTTARVMDGDPILLVTHDEADGGWEFLCGSTNEAVDVRSVELGLIVQEDPSLRALADLPRGWRAWRTSPEDPWRRAPLGLGP